MCSTNTAWVTRMIDFKGRRVEKDIFLSYIYWHLAYPLSNGNLGEMMTERESWVDHQIFIARFENSRQAWKPYSEKSGSTRLTRVGRWKEFISREIDSSAISNVPSTGMIKSSISYSLPITIRRLLCAFSRKWFSNMTG